MDRAWCSMWWKFTHLKQGRHVSLFSEKLSQNVCEHFRIQNTNLQTGSQLKSSWLKRDGQSHRWHISQTATPWLTIIPLSFPHFITSLSKSNSINQSISRVTPPCWKSWWLHIERDNVQFHKAWHLQPCYKLQWCQCQETKLAYGLVSRWPQLLTARNCIQNPVLKFARNSQEMSSIYLKLRWANHPEITPR